MPRNAWCSLAAWMVLLLTACSGADPFVPDARQVEASNRGVGLMGYFDYEGARKVFAQLADANPRWTRARINQAIATYNRQQPGDEEEALKMLAEVLARQPDNLRAAYNRGLLLVNAGRGAEALPYFRQVLAARPREAYAAYFLGQVLAQQNDYAGALAAYRQSLAADPYLRSAAYGAFLTSQRLRERDAAVEFLDIYRRLENNPRARLVEYKYSRLGPLSLVAAEPSPATPPAATDGPLFAAPVPGPQLAAAPAVASLAVLNRSEDGPPMAIAALDGITQVLRWADGAWRPYSDSTLSGIDHVNAVLFGDIDNDGHTDVYFCRQGGNRLLLRTDSGDWRDVTATSGTTGNGGDTRDGLMLDADHDGDLDLLLVNGDGPDQLLSNNRDGSFRDISDSTGIGGDPRPSLGALALDLDRDRDTDLVILHQTPPHRIFINDRLWQYRPAAENAFLQTPVAAAVAGDLDADGEVEIYARSSDGALQRWLPARDWSHQSLDGIPGSALALADASGDGRLQLWSAGPGGARVFAGDHAVQAELDTPLLAAVPALTDDGSGPGLLAISQSGELLWWPPAPGRPAYALLDFSGREDDAESMRSNASGIGTEVAVRRGRSWTLSHGFGLRSGPGQDLQPLAVGLAGASQLDFVALQWSDGVFQTELGLAAGHRHRLSETQRQLSSCPVLFAWDGEGYRFVSDILGVGGIGFLLAPGHYAEPRPWEFLLLPDGLLQARGGRYLLKVSEPMEETAYLDSLRLHAFDLPAGWQLVPDERMATGEPAPTGEPLFYQTASELRPRQATNDRGEDLLATLAHQDGRAAPPGPRDPRFLGRLAADHVLTLEFDRPLDAGAGRPVLVADGWVEYPYAQTLFAAWQAGAAYRPPTLQARGRDGEWRLVHAHFGYPAGMPRRMALPLDALPAGTTGLRLLGNLEIYWDRIRVVYAQTPPTHEEQVLAPIRAEVRAAGYPLRHTGAQRRPDFDYARRAPVWDARYLAGDYTAFGEATALVTNTDDALAIIGSGEELHLEFSAGTPPAPGRQRHFVLEARGWAKDMDLYTRDGGRVDPLPRQAVTLSRQAAVLNSQFNTRQRSGRQ
ncbi:MAG: FG-GAP-like repeat-containing protein [Gammaproteobacteria bacterium]|nr:FG-GAP-like repeat-containing protein [Gammaproteobacteria bacterium]